MQIENSLEQLLSSCEEVLLLELLDFQDEERSEDDEGRRSQSESGIVIHTPSFDFGAYIFVSST